MKGSDVIADFINMLHYKYHKINLNCDGSCADSSNWIDTKKAIMNLVNDGDKCFQYTTTVPVNHEEIGKNLQKLSKTGKEQIIHWVKMTGKS